MIVTTFQKSVVDRFVIGKLKKAIEKKAGYSKGWWDDFARNLDRHTENDFEPLEESAIVTRSIDIFTATNKDNPDDFNHVKEEVESWLNLEYYQRSSGRMKPAVKVNDKQREMIAGYFARINE